MGLAERVPNGEARLFFEQELFEEAQFLLGGGTVRAYSRRSPAKDRANEDALVLVATGKDAAVCAVADGAGGGRSGRQASSLAIQELVRQVESAPGGDTHMRGAILTGFERANRAVMDLGVGAATTLTVVEIQGGTARLYHAGDSFLLVTGQRGRVKLQTIAHSPVGYGVESGILDEEEALYHEERHIVSNVIGSAEMRIEVGIPYRLARRDTLVLASDGLSDNLSVAEIVEAARKGPLLEVTRRLSSLALARMNGEVDRGPSKPDDLTFILFRLV